MSNEVSNFEKDLEEHSNRLKTRIAVFWDLENCQPPSKSTGTSVVQDLRANLLEFGSIRQINAYSDLNLLRYHLRLELQRAGVQLLDVPSTRKDSADKMILTDMLMFALNNPAPQRLVLISGDQDFAYTLARLRNLGFEIILIIPPVGAHPTLRAQADFLLDWQDLFQPESKDVDKRYFEPLVEVLKEFLNRGEANPILSQVGIRLTQRYPTWKKKTGHKKLKDYVFQAKKHEIVEISGEAPAYQVHLLLEKQRMSKKIAEEDRYAPLLTIIGKAHSEGINEIELAAIGLELRDQDPDWQETLGVRKLKDYVDEAVKSGYVTIRSEGLQHYVGISQKEKPKQETLKEYKVKTKMISKEHWQVILRQIEQAFQDFNPNRTTGPFMAFLHKYVRFKKKDGQLPYSNQVLLDAIVELIDIDVLIQRKNLSLRLNENYKERFASFLDIL